MKTIAEPVAVSRPFFHRSMNASFFGPAFQGGAPFFSPKLEVVPGGFMIQRQIATDNKLRSTHTGGQLNIEMAKRLEKAIQYYNWMEPPLQKAVGHPTSKHVINPNDEINQWRWDPEATAGLVLVYNKMKNDNTWQYVERVRSASKVVSMSFYPKGGQASLPGNLAKHGYPSKKVEGKGRWKIRKYFVCGSYLHFKHHSPGDEWVEAHIDLYDPSCVPLGSILHLIEDYILFNKRRPPEFKEDLKHRKVPMSEGILNFLNKEKEGSEGETKPVISGLPANVESSIVRIDDTTIEKWMAKQAHDEWDMAGPGHESERKARYYAILRNSNRLISAQKLAREIARNLTIANDWNKRHRIHNLLIIDHIVVPIPEGKYLGAFYSYEGLKDRLTWIVNLLIPLMPDKASGIKHVKFIFNNIGKNADKQKEIWIYIK